MVLVADTFYPCLKASPLPRVCVLSNFKTPVSAAPYRCNKYILMRFLCGFIMQTVNACMVDFDSGLDACY